MPKKDKKPVHEYRLGRIAGAVWFNEDGNGRGWHSTQISKLYKDGDEWKRTTIYDRDDLPLVAKVANALHTWIFQTWQDKDGSAKEDAPPAEASAAA